MSPIYQNVMCRNTNDYYINEPKNEECRIVLSVLIMHDLNN